MRACLNPKRNIAGWWLPSGTGWVFWRDAISKTNMWCQFDVGVVCFTLRFPMGKPTKLNHNSLAHHHDEALNPKPQSCDLIMGDGLQLVPGGLSDGS